MKHSQLMSAIQSGLSERSFITSQAQRDGGCCRREGPLRQQPSVGRVIEERWKDCRWDVTFAEPGTAAKAMKHLTSSEKTGLLGYLGKHQLGFQDEITESASRKYGPMAKSLGLTLGMPLESQGAATQQVDIYSGTVIDLAVVP